MPDYSLCKVYKIISNQTDLIYIGSTCQELSQRLASHRRDYKRYLNGKCRYVSSYEILKYPDAKIILVQAYPDCQSNMEKLMYEQDWVDCYDCVNKNKAYSTLEQTKEKKKEYQKNNKEYLAEKKKEYYKEHKPQILEYNKEYYNNNKEELLKKQKKYAEKNREKILNRHSQKVICECGRKIARGGLAKHKKKNIHKQLLNNLS